jgi:hypothetical protein
MTDAEAIAYVNWRLDNGMELLENNALPELELLRSALILPIMERKVEEVLKSPTPSECFTNKTVDPEKFIGLAASMIAYPADRAAITEIGKLIALDEKRFGRYVDNVMYGAINRGNPFTVAYQGLELGNPALEKRVLKWIEDEFHPPDTPRPMFYTKWWAEAMVERYGAVPTESQWYLDPIASRIKRPVADSVHDEVLRLAITANEKRTGK